MKLKNILGIVLCLFLVTINLIGAGETILEYVGDIDVYFDESAVVETTYEDGYKILHLEMFDVDEESQKVSLYWGCEEDNPFFSGGSCILYFEGLNRASIDEAGIVVVDMDEDLKILDFVYTAGSALTIYLDDGLVLVNRNPDDLIYYCPSLDYYVSEVDYNLCQELIVSEPISVSGDGTISGEFAYYPSGYDEELYTTVSGDVLLTSTGVRALAGTEVERQGFTINAVSDYVVVPYGTELLPLVENQFVVKEDGLSAQGSGFTFETKNKEYIEIDETYRVFLETAQEYVPMKNDKLKIEMNEGTIDIEILGLTKEYSERGLRTELSGNVKIVDGKLEIYSEDGDVYYSKDFEDITLDSVQMEIIIEDEIELTVEDYLHNDDTVEVTKGEALQLIINPEDSAFEYLFKDIEYFDDRDYFQSGDFPKKGTEEYYHVKTIQHAVGLVREDADGKYGTDTADAVKLWQKSYNELYCNGDVECLEEDGLWGPKTQDAYLETLNKETVSMPLQSSHLKQFDSVEALLEDYFDQAGLAPSIDEKELFLMQTEHINNIGSVGARTKYLEEGDMILIPVESLGYSTASLNYQQADDNSIDNYAWRTIYPEPTYFSNGEKKVFEESLTEIFKDKYNSEPEKTADATRRYGSTKQAGNLFASIFVENVDRYETDSPLESLSMLSALAWQESSLGTGFYYTKEQAGEYILIKAEEEGQLENAKAIAEKLGEDDVHIPVTTGIFQMDVVLQQEKAADMNMPVDENYIRIGSYYPGFATPIAVSHMMDIAELYALNNEGLVEIDDENAKLIAASWNAGPYRARNAAVQDALIELDYLEPTFVDNNGNEKNSRDGVFGSRSMVAFENFVLNYAIKTGEDYDSLLDDLDRAGTGFMGTQVYEALKDEYKEETGKDLALGIVPVDVTAVGKGSQTLDRYVDEVIGNYEFFLDELEHELFVYEEE